MIDQDGHSLSNPSSAIGLATADAMAAESAWENRADRRSRRPTLDKLVGVGDRLGDRGRPAELRRDRPRRRRRSAAPRARSQGSTENEKLKQAGGANGGVTGTTANIPGAAATNGSRQLRLHARQEHRHERDRHHADRHQEGGRHAASRCPSRSSSRRRRSRTSSRAPRRTRRASRGHEDHAGHDRQRGRLDTDEHARTRSRSRPSTPSRTRPVAQGGRRPVGRRRRRRRRAAALGGLIPAPFGGIVKPIMAGIGLLVLLFLVRKSLAAARRCWARPTPRGCPRWRRRRSRSTS